MIQRGHSFAEVQNYTPDQIAMFAAAASRQHGEDLLASMNANAAASSAGFTGNSKALENVEKAIRGVSGARGGELQRRLKSFARSAGAEVR